MIILGRPQFTQQLTPAELDEVQIVRGERFACHPNVNGFAGANEIRGLFTNIKHDGTLLTNRETRSEGKDYVA